MAVPTATSDPNILAVVNGTVLRSYSTPALDGMNDDNLGDAANGIGSELPDGAKPPYVFTFELPGPAKISEFEAVLRSADTSKGLPSPSLTLAVSTTTADAVSTTSGRRVHGRRNRRQRRRQGGTGQITLTGTASLKKIAA